MSSNAEYKVVGVLQYKYMCSWTCRCTETLRNCHGTTVHCTTSGTLVATVVVVVLYYNTAYCTVQEIALSYKYICVQCPIVPAMKKFVQFFLLGGSYAKRSC